MPENQSNDNESQQRTCHCCGASISQKRIDARFCSASCRASSWRETQQKPVSVKVILPRLEFNAVKQASVDAGLFMNAWIIGACSSKLEATCQLI